MQKERLSPNQYAMLREVVKGKAGEGDDAIKEIHAGTFGSLLTRGFLTVDSFHTPIVTEAGETAYSTYKDLEMPRRKHPGEITDFVAMMLGLRRSRITKINRKTRTTTRRPNAHENGFKQRTRETHRRAG